MPAKKRTLAAWLAIGFLCFDIAAEVMRLGVCVTKPEVAPTTLCADPIGPLSRFVARLAQLLSEVPVIEPPPMVPPAPAPPPVAPVSPLDRIRSGETL